MAAPAFGSIGTHLLGSSASASFAVPAGVAANDVIVIPIFIDVAARTLSALAAGFVHAEGSPIVGASNSLAVVWKRASGADAGTYDFTLDLSTYRAGSAIRYAGCVTTGSPWDSPVGTAFDNISGTVTPAVSLNTLGPDRLLAFYATNWGGGAWTPPASFTERLDTGDQVITADDLAQAVQGNSGSVTATCVGSDKRTAWLGALIGTTPSTPPAASFYVSIPLHLLQQFAAARQATFTAGAAAAITASGSADTITHTSTGAAGQKTASAAAAPLARPATTAAGQKATSAAGTPSVRPATGSAGQKVASGPGTAVAHPAVTGAGRKVATGAGSGSAHAVVAATGLKVAAGAGSTLAHPGSTAAGSKTGAGAAVVPARSSTVAATGHLGAAVVSAHAAVVATGFKVATASAAPAARVATTATGQHRGTGVATVYAHPVTVASGRRAATGAAAVQARAGTTTGGSKAASGPTRVVSHVTTTAPPASTEPAGVPHLTHVTPGPLTHVVASPLMHVSQG